jgi:hypothetical protein
MLNVVSVLYVSGSGLCSGGRDFGKALTRPPGLAWPGKVEEMGSDSLKQSPSLLFDF